MKSRTLLFLTAAGCFSLIGVALYLQLAKDMQPCPLCILQRYAFLALGVMCLVGAAANAPRIGAGFGLLAALAGVGIAGHHVWIMAHPSMSCGIDPLETALNKIPPAKWLPTLFQADGLCTTAYAPVFGLSIPQWSLLWFLVFTLILVWILVGRRARQR